MAHDRPDQAADETGGEDLSRMYAQTPGIEPPAALDELILNAASKEVRSAPSVSGQATPAGPKLHRAPWAMAALVVLAAMLYQVVPEQDAARPEPIVVSMADPASRDIPDLQSPREQASAMPAAPVAEMRGLGAASGPIDLRQAGKDSDSGRPAEQEMKETDDVIAVKPMVIARSANPVTTVAPEPYPARPNRQIETRSKAAAIAMPEPDPPDEQTLASRPEKRTAGALLQQEGSERATAVAEAAQLPRSTGQMSRERALAAAPYRKREAAGFADQADAVAVSGARTDVDAQAAAAPGEAVAGQVLIFAGAIDSGVLAEQAGNFDGLGAELARRVLGEAGYRVEFRAMPLNQAVEQTRSGAVDAVIGVVAFIDADASISFCKEAFTPDGRVFAFSRIRGFGGLCEPFDAEIARLRSTGELAAMQRQYGLR